MELKTMKTSTAQSSFNPLRGLKLAALAIGTSFVLAGCAGNSSANLPRSGFWHPCWSRFCALPPGRC